MNASTATPQQIEAINTLQRRLATDCTPPEVLATWPSGKADRQIAYLTSLVDARRELPRLRAQWVSAMRLLAQTGADVSTIPSLPPMATPDQIEQSIHMLATGIDIARGGNGTDGLYAVQREIARAGRALRDRGANVDAGFYLYEGQLIRIVQAPEGDLYATFRDPATEHSWQYLKVSMYRVYLHANVATSDDLARWGRGTGMCFVCGRRLGHARTQEQGIHATCATGLRARPEDDHR